MSSNNRVNISLRNDKKLKEKKNLSYKFLLYANSISERGDSVALISVYEGLRKYFGIDAIITYNENNSANSQSRISELTMAGYQLEAFHNRAELEDLVERFQISHVYIFSNGLISGLDYVEMGKNNFRLGNTFHITHAVFSNFEPHGDMYLYVSRWLYKKNLLKISIYRALNAFRLSQNTYIGWWPHMVSPLKGKRVQFRKQHGIPVEAKVVGRIGGFNQFNDRAAKVGILELLNTDKDIWVVLVNTQRYTSHPRVIHIDYLNRIEIWDFYAASDVLINGRLMGESFGFGIVEALSCGRPVIAPNWTRNPRMDKHHIALLRNLGFLYNSKSDFVHKIKKQLVTPVNSSEMIEVSKVFSPEIVMNQLNKLIHLDEE